MPLTLTDEQLNEMFDKIPALAGRPRRLEELSGGLTNRNVKITTPDGVYVARCTDTVVEHARNRPGPRVLTTPGPPNKPASVRR